MKIQYFFSPILVKNNNCFLPNVLSVNKNFVFFIQLIFFLFKKLYYFADISKEPILEIFFFIFDITFED